MVFLIYVKEVCSILRYLQIKKPYTGKTDHVKLGKNKFSPDLFSFSSWYLSPFPAGGLAVNKSMI